MQRLSEENTRPVQPLNRLLKIAAAAGVESAVRLHIKRGDDINGRDDSGQTPLMIAASRNRAAVCRLLIEEGADFNLKDLSGNNALTIARNAGANDAIAIIQDAIAFEKSSLSEILPSQELVTAGSSGQSFSNALDFSDDDDDSLNLSDWEPELDTPVPESDISLVQKAVEVHKLISDHTPIDLSEDWADFEVFLPEKAFQAPKLIDEDFRTQIQQLFLRAVREGSVPESIIDEISSNFPEPDCKEIYSLIETIVNDLGAETDTRFEIEPPLEVTDETFYEADEVQAAMNFMDDIASHNNDSLRYFVRDMSKTSLLSADDEIFLGKEMEAAFDGALDALAAWEGGLKKLIHYANLVENGEIEVEWISSGKANDPIDFDDESILGDENDTDSYEIDNILDGVDELKNSHLSPAAQDFLASINDLLNLLSDIQQANAQKALVKSCLSKLVLTRAFLLELASDKKFLIEGGDAAARFDSYVKRQEHARNRMITSNLRLVMSVAKRYQSFRMPFEDLVQEGNLGLMKAVDRFDWRRGFKFSTYATWWIRQAISRVLADKGRTIRVPVHVNELMYKIAKEAEQIENKTGKYPPAEEIAVNLQISSAKVLFSLKNMNEPVSIEELRSNNISNIELITDSSVPDPFVSVAYKNLNENLNFLLAELKSDQARIVRLRYGLEDGHMYTLQEIGELMGVTRERIRQIESKAISKLSFPERSQHLLAFLEVDFSGVAERRFPYSTSKKIISNTSDLEANDAG